MKAIISLTFLMLLSGCYCMPGKSEPGAGQNGYFSGCWNQVKDDAAVQEGCKQMTNPKQRNHTDAVRKNPPDFFEEVKKYIKGGRSVFDKSIIEKTSNTHELIERAANLTAKTHEMGEVLHFLVYALTSEHRGNVEKLQGEAYRTQMLEMIDTIKQISLDGWTTKGNDVEKRYNNHNERIATRRVMHGLAEFHNFFLEPRAPKIIMADDEIMEEVGVLKVNVKAQTMTLPEDIFHQLKEYAKQQGIGK